MRAPRRSAADQGRSAPRLYLVTPAIDTPGLAAKLAAALETVDVAAVLARSPIASEGALVERIRTIAPVVQSNGSALLIERHAPSVEPAGADGAHVSGIAALEGALPGLKPRYIVGCGGLYSRHDAMVAGERGADYVMFGEPDADGRRPAFAAVLDRVAWWAELFEIPCVGWAMNFDEITALAHAGADFVAIGEPVWAAPEGPGAAMAAAADRLSVSEQIP
jgi:thiamine-phosphate pyrophosphorylase